MAAGRRPADVFTRDLDLPRGPTRERVSPSQSLYHLRASEVRMLATVGAFRVVAAVGPSGHRGPARTGPRRRPRAPPRARAGPRRVPDARARRATLVTLTDAGRDLLESPSRPPRGRDRQTLLRRRRASARELSHDAQVYRAYQRGGRPHASRGRAGPTSRPRLRAQARLPAVPAGPDEAADETTGGRSPRGRRGGWAAGP